MINKLRMIMFLGLLTSIVVFISGCVQEKAVWNETKKETQPTTTPYTNIPTITETPTIKASTFLYKGFDDINLFKGAYWKYSWEYASSGDPTLSGTLLIELTDSEDWNLKGLGKLTFYRIKYTLSGDAYPLSITKVEYLAAKEGVIYLGQYQGNNVGAVRLFDSRDGHIYDEGFIGYFSANRKKSVGETTMNNRPAVVISERYYKPMCQITAGVETCDDQSHDYVVREYYLPHIGFGGFYRSGTSVFTGGGLYDRFTSTMDMRLIDTNII